MEKLTFYALSVPEELDCIGAYLSKRMSKDVARQRYRYVCIAMEALDQLLMACRSQSINLFVESFLKMVREVLESDKPSLQILGTNSFVKFANIQEDNPSYHRCYHFFVSRFSDMCHFSDEDPDICFKIRMAGIKGLNGVVRKTVNDDLQANIWDPELMGKIVPSLLFNLQSGECTQNHSPSLLQMSEKEKSGLVELTECCFRELLRRAAYGKIKNVITPVLMHLDNHCLWEGTTFAVHCFKIIMYSIRSQHSHLVIQQLLGHLAANSKNSATVRAGIIEVLLEAAAIAASCSVGLTVLEIFNTLVQQLHLSVDYELTGSYDGSINIGSEITNAHEERQLQEAVIRTISSFANTLPAYQRSEVMLFIMGKIPGIHTAMPSTGSGPEGTRMIQVMLLKSLVQVTASFHTTNMLKTQLSSYLEPLLSVSLTKDPEVQLLALQILISLMDWHDNRSKLLSMSSILDISVLKIKVVKCSRQDNLFMKGHGQQLYQHIYLACKEQSNGRQHYEKLFALFAILSVELANPEVVLDLVRLTVALQDLALSTDEDLPIYNRCAIHSLTAAYFNLICQLTTIPAFCKYIHEVIKVRQVNSPHLLPEGVFTYNPKLPASLENVEGDVLFLQSKISEVLGGGGYNTERLSIPFIPQYTDDDHLSIGETVSQVELQSRNSPEKEERRVTEEITFKALKNVIVGSVDMEEQDREWRRRVMEKFQKAPFKEIAAHCGPRATQLHRRLNQILEITIRPPPSPAGTMLSSHGQSQRSSVPIYDMTFPDLFLY
nr:protein EFR3 homolog B-like [Solea senegalensis]XP_043885749.1 protein EFR3 homolog B-like [Solea senegalensis]